jgi:1-acyl-sn-glycerol-3-phosphate acyltransferase
LNVAQDTGGDAREPARPAQGAGPTWNDAPYVVLPPLTRGQRARGGLRVAGMVAVTALALALFVPGQALRRRLLPGLTAHYAVAGLWSQAMVALLGVRIRVVGQPLRGAGVIVANHATWGDILALRAVTRINFVAKAEVRAWAGIGWVAEVCETVFIERRRMASRDQASQLRARMAAGETLCIFAEGTSSDGQRVLPFKSALLSAVVDIGHDRQVAVQPVTLNWLPREGLPPAFYGWWGTMGFEAHIWQVACRGTGGTVEIVFHPATAAGATTDRKALTRACEAAVRSAKRPCFEAG